MATIEDIARHIDDIDEPDKVLRLHAIAKAISDDFAPGYRPNFNEYPTPGQTTMKLSTKKARTLSGQMSKLANAATAIQSIIDSAMEADPAPQPETYSAEEGLEKTPGGGE